MRRRNAHPRRIRCKLSEAGLVRIASRARYEGSSEHKSHPSPAGQPRLRSDATPCDPDILWADINSALAEGIRRGCISEATEQGFPRCVWGWLGDDLYEARHLNGLAGGYKGYRLEPPDYPRDPDNRLGLRPS